MPCVHGGHEHSPAVHIAPRDDAAGVDQHLQDILTALGGSNVHGSAAIRVFRVEIDLRCSGPGAALVLGLGLG